MPLEHSSSDAAFKTNVKTLIGEVGKSPHVKNRAQALAIAYAVKRRGHADGGDVSEDSITADFARQAAADRTRRAVIHRPAFAFGGFSPYGVKQTPNRMMHTEARNMVHTGPIMSAVAGRTDHHPMSVKAGSYVLPADHVSSLGQGNTQAGMALLGHMFGHEGPYGVGRQPAIKHGGLPRPPRLRHAGGAGSASDGRPVPIAAAGGEYIIPPEVVEVIGGGDIKHGHAILDDWVVQNRKKHVKTLQKLPGPAKS